jgi:hypothetical protein
VAFTKEGGLETKGSELRNVRERELEQESALQVSVSRLRCRTLSTAIDYNFLGPSIFCCF